MEEALEAIATIDNAVLLIVGSGDVLLQLKAQAEKEKITEKVIFIDRVPYADLLQFTHAADAGLSLDKDTNINYKYSLPNKLFDYIFCDIPVLSSRVVEVASIVKRYKIGEVASDFRAETIARNMEKVIQNKKEFYAEGLQNARAELNWENEKKVLVEFYSRLKNELNNG
jgi:glycosyltransferase involved in cell wall biosynthesis